jgi:hypothetical protein
LSFACQKMCLRHQPCYYFEFHSALLSLFSEREVLALRLIAGVLLGIWLLLVLLGKGGFVHILLLNGIAVAVVDLVAVYRHRATIESLPEPETVSTRPSDN